MTSFEYSISLTTYLILKTPILELSVVGRTVKDYGSFLDRTSLNRL